MDRDRCTVLNVSVNEADGTFDVYVAAPPLTTPSPLLLSHCHCCCHHHRRPYNHYHRYMKQPCFATLQHKPCGQSTSVPAHLENTGVADLQPGEWFLSRSAEGNKPTIVYNPLDGEDVSAADVVMPVLEQLIVARGTNDMSPAHQFKSRPNTGLGYVEQQSGALVDTPAYEDECVDFEWKPMPSNIVFSGRE